MPKLLDSLALSLALSATACGAANGVKGSLRHDELNAQKAHFVATNEIMPDGYDCRPIQEKTKRNVWACCLTIAPFKDCQNMPLHEVRNFTQANTTPVNGSRVANYRPFKDYIPAETYMDYLAKMAGNAEGLAKAMSSFLHYEDVSDDRLLPAVEIMAEGGGDCDNQANLFVELLKKLGKHTGHDYKARIIGMAESKHAVAIFLDTDSVWKSFDQSLPFNQIGTSNSPLDLLKASQEFGKSKTKEHSFFERSPLIRNAGKGARMDVYIDPNTLLPSGGELAITPEIYYQEGMSPDEFAGGNEWRKFTLTHVHFKNGVEVYYNHGVLTQVSDRGKTSFYKNNVVIQIQYEGGSPVKREDFNDDGILTRRAYRSGIEEVYENGVLYQKIYEKGLIDFEVFFKSGGIRQRSYRDGRVELFDESGRRKRK